MYGYGPGDPNLYAYQLQQMWTHIQRQEARIAKLEETAAAMRGEIEELKRQRGIHIDRIEYKFDQLKVEQLDGTLTIGVSPAAVDEIEDFAVNGMDADSPDNEAPSSAGFSPHENREPAPTGEARTSADEGAANGHLHDFLDREAMEELIELAAKRHLNIGADESRRVMEDLRRQIEARVRQYASSPDLLHGGGQEPPGSATWKLIEKTKADIRAGILNYLAHYQKGKGDEHP
ncbi:spore germination protein GerPC [Paenibacillus sp. UNC499MF]|uniref:spore germination protein GerPC n=1 Tax=Paenibacillus sp. UNC499MF TaxID=1502751 RepID=UPI0008A06F8F|nr:spore germination protein GerPC [Paenibacillus sp. UNC499MF]SEG52462.1 spore germination protein PC [Paenibacillus sp. UNC499MF]